MGARASRLPTMFSWTLTLGAMKDADVRALEHCSRCKHVQEIDLDAAIAKAGPLFTLWNYHPSCRVEGCDGQLTFRAQVNGSGVWPVLMTGGDPGQVAFLQERWRAARLNHQIGGEMALQLIVRMIQHTTRLGLFSDQDKARMIADTVAALPRDSQADATWLLEHYIMRDQPRPGWR